MRNSWKARLYYGLTLWVTGVLHHKIVQDVSNTPEGMFVYHFSAACVDFMLLLFASAILRGRLSSDMQQLCIMSMVVNFVGWILYLGWAPPIFYDRVMVGLSVIQYAWLIMAEFNDYHLGDYMVRSDNLSRAKFYFRKKNP